jgi:hypothetical protein
VFNSELLEGKEGFGGKQMRPTICMLLLGDGKDSKSLCGGVVSYMCKGGEWP